MAVMQSATTNRIGNLVQSGCLSSLPAVQQQSDPRSRAHVDVYQLERPEAGWGGEGREMVGVRATREERREWR